MTTIDQRRFFNKRKAGDARLVLASVYDTLGSTYSKTGAQMLIAGDGDFQGMLSGGCLEGDLAERARQVIDTGEPQLVTYDLRQNDEELWGLGVGCDGLIRIFLQALSAQSGYQPYAAMIDLSEREQTGIAATVLESDDPQAPPGATLVGHGVDFVLHDLSEATASKLAAAAVAVLAEKRSVTRDVDVGVHTLRVLYTLLELPPNILVLGGGLDAEPLVRLCTQLGWRVTVQDHRPAYIEKGEFEGAQKVLCVPAATLPESVDLHRYDAAIVMSHHLATDQVYLEQLAATDMDYVGLLGPVERRNRLVGELGPNAARLEHRLHGPAGIDIGGRGPASIALSIVAQMHQVLVRGTEIRSESRPD